MRESEDITELLQGTRRESEIPSRMKMKYSNRLAEVGKAYVHIRHQEEALVIADKKWNRARVRFAEAEAAAKDAEQEFRESKLIRDSLSEGLSDSLFLFQHHLKEKKF